MILCEGKNDPTTHLQLDHKEECTDDNDIIGMNAEGDVVCNSIISQLIRQLVEECKIIDSQ